MTTKELRDELDKLMAEMPETADWPVETEGCDCDGDTAEVQYGGSRLHPGRQSVLITRPE